MTTRGHLRHQLDLEEDKGRSSADTDHGDHVPDWRPIGRVYASVTPLLGRELERARQVQPDATHRVELNYRPGLTSRHRLRRGSRVWHFAEPPRDLDERRRRLVILAIEREA